MVKVKLAGINVPIQIRHELEDLKKELETSPESDESKLSYASHKLGELAEKFTPEIVSAAYARISRSKKNVDELVEQALMNVPKARESNEAIIFGMGHHSVADHAMFNFNIKGVSRLLVEEIEKRRIGVGYTEKSQRYVTLEGDFVRPKEYSLEDLKEFEGLVGFQNDSYFKINKRLFEYLQKKHSDKIKKLEGKEKNDFVKKLEGSAKEDARYPLCLATEAQLGCSYPGQTLELAIRKLKYGRLLEGKEFAQQLFDESVQYAPSLIQLTDPEVFRQHNPGQELQDDNFKYTENNLGEIVEKVFEEAGKAVDSDTLTFYRFSDKSPATFMKDEGLGKNLATFLKNGNVTLIECSNIDLNILAALLHEYSKESIENSYALAFTLIEENKAKDFTKEALKHLSEYDKVPRAYEMSNGLMYEGIISSSCFAQLKRHRMMTLLSQDYNPKLGFTTPSNIEEIGADKELKEVVDRSSELYYEFLPKYGKAAEYCLTNAHRRRVLIGINMRQLYHISRTREDEHAQWEIRDIANSMSALAKQEAPITTVLLGGQGEFPEIRKNIYNDFIKK
nr:FAD-dependent thymidylate synthase [Nanoarchaeota archaeon]